MAQNGIEQNNTSDNLCNSCSNYGCVFQSGIVRTNCAFYIPPHIEPDNCGNYVVMQPTTLEQELCEDAISRQAVLNKKELVELEDGQSFYCISPEDVEALPSVIPKQRTGRWVQESGAVICNTVHWFRCSECDEEKAFRTAYCPNCGAKMEEQE